MSSIDYLYGLEQFGIKLGLANIRALCRALGDPHQAFASIIVAGTNGKGSVTALTDAALRAAGHHVARYTSPHLVALEERFVIDGQPVSASALADAVETVRLAAERLRASGDLLTHPTFFEVTTAAAFELFRRAGVAVAVLEVGLGGRFDATNIVDPLAAAITSIDLDHEQYLGNTIAGIAFEKAGVIKDGTVVILGERKAEAVAVVERVCAERGARLVHAHDDVATAVRIDDGLTILRLSTPVREYAETRLGLRGRHQIANAVVAVRLLEEIEARGLAVGPAAIETALGTTTWPARLQVCRLPGGRELVLDAAHNPAGASMLAAYLEETWRDPMPIVFGAMRDKSIDEMLRRLSPRASALILTQPRLPRAATATELLAKARVMATTVPSEAIEDSHAALDRAWTHGPRICVCGSIFLAGEVLQDLGLL